ncbi:unnamed protein product [Symbiodinium sp. CCMP2456]|nr:unnamed protein product [Symbiodinium sp. CCMP2456]
MAGCLKANELAKGQRTTSGVFCGSLVPRRSEPLLHGCGVCRLVAFGLVCLHSHVFVLMCRIQTASKRLCISRISIGPAHRARLSPPAPSAVQLKLVYLHRPLAF